MFGGEHILRLQDREEAEVWGKEERANQFAAKLLRHSQIYKFFLLKRKYISEYRVLDCADKVQVHPGVVVGALQHQKVLNPRNLNKYKHSVLDKIPSEHCIENQDES